MGLFENLFKPRPDGTLERIVEAPLRASGLVERAAAADGEEPPDPATAFLQPKGYAPGTTGGGASAQNQGFVPVLPTAKRAPAHDRRPAPASPPAGTVSTVILTVADVLPRIPGAFLRPGPHDLRRELRFHIEDLASDITRGRPVIALSCIAEQCPELFHQPISDDDDMAIRLPLQKLVEQVGNYRASTAPAAAPFVLPPAKPAVTAPAPPRLAPPAPASTAPAPSAPVEPIAPPVVAKAVEPVTSAPVVPPSAPPPVIVAPPVVIPEVVAPVVSAPAPPVMPAPPVAPEPVAEVAAPEAEAVAPAVEPAPPVIEAVKPVIEPVGRAAEPVAPVVEPVVPVAESVAPVVEPVAPVVEAVAPVFVEPAPEPERPVERQAFGSMIDLSLAALVAKVPREMLPGLPPRIADGERISLPFPPIERQLGTGSVSVSARVFWDALPPLLRHHFTLREDLTVPVPLEEIFQNLPVGDAPEKIRLDPIAPPPRPAPEVLSPVVLAPTMVDEATPQLDFDTPRSAPVPAPAPIEESTPLPEPSAAVAEAPAPPEPAAPPLPEPHLLPEPPLVSEPVPSSPGEDIVLAATVAAQPEPESAASAAPDETQPGIVHLQPLRVLHLPTPAVEAEATAEAASAEPPILGAVSGDLASLPADAHVLQGNGAVPALESEPVEEAASEQMAPPAPEPVPAFSVLPSPPPEEVPAALPPEPEPLVAFNPDLPPPLRVETPAAAVAVLHASVPPPMEMPAVAMASGSVQPPPMFRPMVLPPPISSVASAPPVQLAPRLSGPGSIHGMISLSPTAEVRPPAIFPAMSAPPPPAPPAPAPAAPVAKAPPAIALTPVVPSLPIAPAPVEKPSVSPPVSAPPPPAAFTPPPIPAATRAPDPTPTPAPVPVPQLAPLRPPESLIAASAPAATAPVVPAPKPAESLNFLIPPLPVAPPAAPPAVEHVPPAIPISRFDQHSLQSLFMTEETLDLPRVARLAASLPGIQACVIATRGETHSSGALPEGFQLSALRGLSPQVDAAADRLPIGQLKNFTLYGEQYSISFFERPAVCLCAIHRARSFVPGVREKLVAVVDELARG